MRIRAVRWAARRTAPAFAAALTVGALQRAQGAPHTVSANKPAGRDRAPLVVSGSGTCPDPQLVETMLRSFDLPSGSLHDRGTPEVNDLGDRFRVSAAGHVREYDDPSHDCAERARIAAVFAALTLAPPELLPEAPPPPPPPPAPVPAAAEAPRPPFRSGNGGGPPWGRFEAAGRFEGAPALADSQAFFEGGAMIRLALGWSASWGAELGVGLLASRIMQLDGAKAREQRFPFELGVRWRTREAPFELAVALGLSGAWFTTEGNELAVSDRQSRLDLGLGAALQGRWPSTSRLAPFLGVRAQYFPRAYGFSVTGRGDVGSTPKFRVAGEIGLSVALE
jgi:hypothetical protein